MKRCNFNHHSQSVNLASKKRVEEGDLNITIVVKGNQLIVDNKVQATESQGTRQQMRILNQNGVPVEDAMENQANEWDLQPGQKIWFP